jgi:hypothetical protein
VSADGIADLKRPEKAEGDPMGLPDLSSILWREREMLELLLFKMEEEQLVLAAGRTRWLAHATREVELVLEQIRQAEVLRAAEVEVVAAEQKLGSNPSLANLAESVPEPWSTMLKEHRKAFMALAAEISALAEANRDLLTAGQRAARETMLAFTGSVETYGPKGSTVSTAPRRRLVDEAM